MGVVCTRNNLVTTEADTDFSVCTYNQIRSRRVPTTTYILALEERVKKLQEEISKSGKFKPAKETLNIITQDRDETNAKRTTIARGILLETMVGTVG
jgi:hypothetical protein